ncbi:MAG TPA: hypothetical protein VHM92_05605 [Allosphingosinicella sp.]|nr:hypothetical protein [Allosphingosinicella sp.]
MNDAATSFLRAVRAGVAWFSGFVLEEMRSRAWASVTFAGCRHQLSFRLQGEGAEEAAAALLGGLSAREFPMRGHLLADVAIVSQERRPGSVRISLEALTVEDG